MVSMRVLYFHQYFSTPSGSTGTRSYEMAQSLITRGHEVTVVCGSGRMSSTGLAGKPVKGTRRGKVDGIDIIELDLPYSNYDSFLKRSWIFLLFAWQAACLRRITRKKSLCRKMHGTTISGLSSL